MLFRSDSSSSSLAVDDPELFALYVPDFTVDAGPLYRYVGRSALTGFDLSNADFSAIDSNGQALWQPVSTGTATYNTTATAVSIAVGDPALVMDTRADLITDAVVLVRTAASYGYYQFRGAAARRELLQEDYGDSARWTALTIGSENAEITTTSHPTGLTPGTLITDPSLLTGVTLRLQTPVSIAASGSVNASSSSGVRLSSAGTLSIGSVATSGLLHLTAAALSQSDTGAGLSNDRGPIELRKIGRAHV